MSSKQPSQIPGGSKCGCGNPTCPQCFPNGVPANFPGLTPNKTPQPKELPKFTAEHEVKFQKMQDHCYEELHRPCCIKIIGYEKQVFYICRDCLDAFMAKDENKELKEIVVAFER